MAAGDLPHEWSPNGATNREGWFVPGMPLTVNHPLSVRAFRRAYSHIRGGLTECPPVGNVANTYSGTYLTVRTMSLESTQSWC